MKISVGWLRDLVATKLDADAIAQRLTEVGLEVEGIERPGEALRGVVVARIAASERHPHADKLSVCRVETGQQRSGMYYGVWGLATKISEALALAAVGWILTGFGYVPNVEQTPHALFGIRLFFGLVPAVCILAALPFLLKYPITRKSHAEVRRKLEIMDQAAGDNEPVRPL